MKQLVLAVASIGLLGVAIAPSARADQWNKKTILTVNETIQVPNKVLPPGKYVIKLLDSPSNRHIVQIFNGDETHLLTTILAIPNYRLQPTGKTVFGFWETPPGQPKALRAWFYPGDNFGQEFAYPKSAAVQIAASAHAAVPTTEVTEPSRNGHRSGNHHAGSAGRAPRLPRLQSRNPKRPRPRRLLNQLPPQRRRNCPKPPARIRWLDWQDCYRSRVFLVLRVVRTS